MEKQLGRAIGETEILKSWIRVNEGKSFTCQHFMISCDVFVCMPKDARNCFAAAYSTIFSILQQVGI